MADVARLSYSAHIARLPPRVALYLQASIIVSFLAASSAPTSLYAVYQARWDLTPILVTIVFGIYALAVLAALLTASPLRPAATNQASAARRRAGALCGLGASRIRRVTRTEPERDAETNHQT